MKKHCQAIVLLCLLGTTRLSAQEPTFAIKVDVPLVSLDVSVKTGSKPVRGLTKEDFLLYQDGHLQEIQHFSSSVEPINLFAVAPWSLPYGLPRPRSNQGEVEEVERFLADRFYGFVKTSYQILDKSNGPTYAELELGVKKMRSIAGRKGIVVMISCSGYIPPREPDSVFQDLVKLVRESVVPMYVFFPSDLHDHNGHGQINAPWVSRLKTLAEASGGEYFDVQYPGSFVHSSIEAATRFTRNLVATSYTLAYSPASGRAHRIEIRLSEERLRSLKNQDVTIWQSREAYGGK